MLDLKVFYLYIQQVHGGEGAALQENLQTLGEDQAVWTKRVPAERRVRELTRVLHFHQAGSFQHITHLVQTAGGEENVS